MTTFQISAVYFFSILAALAIYFVPTLIAFNRNLSCKWSVFVINLFLGWTVLAWIICLSIAVNNSNSNNDSKNRI